MFRTRPVLVRRERFELDIGLLAEGDSLEEPARSLLDQEHRSSSN